MTSITTLALQSSWPLSEQGRKFELGRILDSVVVDQLVPDQVGEVGPHHAGCWECNLSDNSLIWSGAVYDLFGFARGSTISRDHAAGLYCEDSRVKMENLRRHAIDHLRGFTIDVQIQPAFAERRWMRLVAAPVCVDGRAVRLHGLKLAI